MKLGCCTGSFGTPGDPAGTRVYPLLKKYGYDYAELPLAQVMELSEEDFCRVLEALEESGIPAEACNNFFPASVRLTGPERDEGKIKAYLEAAFARAGRLGVSVIVFGSSGAKNVPEGFDHSAAFQQIVDTLKLVGPMAQAAGITIAIEPLNRKESNIILNTGEGARLAEAVDHPNVRLLVDYYHYALEDDKLTPRTAALLAHSHFADPDGRHYPTQLKPEFSAFLEELKSLGYDARMSIEASAPNGEADLRAFPELFGCWR